MAWPPVTHQDVQDAVSVLRTGQPTLAGRAIAGRTQRLPAGTITGTSTGTGSYTKIIAQLGDGITKVFTNSSFSGGQIGVSTDGVTFTWGKNFEGGNGLTESLVETPGGEVLVSVSRRDNTAGVIYRSTGWNPATADATSWAIVLTADGPNVYFDGRWGLTQRSVAPLASPRAGAIFVCEYGYHISEAATAAQAAIHAWMSTNDGATWTSIFDLRNFNTDTNAHVHAIAYDPYDDRVIITVGDNANTGIYYCNGEDLAAPVWTAITGTTGSNTYQSTTVIPMMTALVLLSDSPTSAIYRIPRNGYRSYGSIVAALTIAAGGTATIGAHAYQSDSYGPALFTVYSSSTSGPPAIYASMDGSRFTTAYLDSASVSGGPGIVSITGPDTAGHIWATKSMTGSGVLFTGTYNPPGAAGISTGRQILTGAGISGGGDLSADRTLIGAHNTAAAQMGLIAQSIPAFLADSSSTALTSGTLYVIRVITEDGAVSAARTIRLYQWSAASALTLAKTAVYDSSGTQVGASADQSSTWNTAGPTNRTISTGTFAVTKGATYYITILVVGTTGPTFSRYSNQGPMNAGLSGASLLFATGPTSLTDVPTTITPSSLNPLSLALWAGLL